MRRIQFVLWMVFMAGAASAQQGNHGLLDGRLGLLRGRLVVTTRRYDGTNVIGEDTLYKARGVTRTSGMRVSILGSAVPQEPAAIDITVACKATAALPATAVAASFSFSGWNPANYVLVPASVYNGNRYRAIGNGYNPAYPKDMYYNPSAPVTISNNPRLALEKGQPSLIELQTGNVSTPALCFFSARAKKGFIVLTTQGTRLGENGLVVAENARQDSCSLQVSAPSMRKLAAGFGDFHASGDKAPDWVAGDSLTLRFRVFVFDAADIPTLLRKFFRVRKSLTGENHPRDLLPKSQQFQFGTDISRGLWSENPAGNYYLPENSKNFQLGWVGGLMNTLPLLALDSPLERQRVAQELDFVVRKLQGRSGFFFGGITSDGRIEAEKMNPEFPQIQAMVRKNGDALFWMIKHFELLRAQGHGEFIKAEWEASARKLAEAFVRTWKRYGQFGQYIVPDNGDIAVFNSAAGSIAPAGLVLASDYFKEPEFLAVAKASAAYYYRQFVAKQGLTGGNCGDISQDADSESAFAFLESLMALYHATGDRLWLERAETEAALCSTWVLSYDEKFPTGSDIDRLGAHMAGAVFASIQNKHAAPGICTSSGDYLFKLYRATGKQIYADLIRDIQHAAAEALNRPGHLTTRNLIGSSMERIQPSDAEGRRATGNFINTRNTWTETDGVMMALELPGVYVQTDTKRMMVFDHVTAKLSSGDGGGLTLVLENPTAYDASASVMAETSRQAAIPMGYTGFLKWQVVRVKAGGKTIVHIGADGRWTEIRSAGDGKGECRAYTISLKPYQAPQDVVPVAAEEISRTVEPRVSIAVDQQHPGQVMDGIGGAFNELGWAALSALTPEARASVLYHLFDTAGGAAFRFNRIPIGASDFARSAYSLDDSVGDWGLEYFSIRRDESCLIPYIKAAQAVNSSMRFHASPWSPPGWMKTNGRQTGGGELLGDDRTLGALARYLVLWLEAYQGQDIHIDRLCPQNEPLVSGSYPGCKIPASLYGRLVKDFVVPAVERSGLSTQVWAGTFNYWRADTRPHFDTLLQDSNLAAQVRGFSFQYSNMEWVREFTTRYPMVALQFSESECYNGRNSHEEVLRDFQDFLAYVRAGVKLFTFWNMVLPEPHKSTWGWAQNSPVVIDSATGIVTYEPSFALARFLGRFVHPGDLYLPAQIESGDSLVGALNVKPADAVNFMQTGLAEGRQVAAFERTDGTVTVLLYNQGGARTVAIHLGDRTVRSLLPEKSLVALEVAPVNPKPFVIPGLQTWEGGIGDFRIGARTAIVLDPAGADSLKTAARLFQSDLRQMMGGGVTVGKASRGGMTGRGAFPIRIGKPAAGDIWLSLGAKDSSLGTEGYLIEAGPSALRISGVHPQGVIWGTRTLLQVLEQDSLHRSFPCGLTRDFPKYAIRGFVLDVGRKFFPMDFLKEYVKFMAYYKMNDFHIHLNDDGGHRKGSPWDSAYAAFRLQCDTYPGLTATDGSYTKAEFRAFEAYARSYGVNIVPEIDVPAHSLAFTRMRPEIGSQRYGMDHLDLDNPVTYRVIDSVFREYLSGPNPVFSGADVHIGTDEYNKQAAEQFRAFTDHYIRLVQGYGKKVRLWGALTHAPGVTPVTSKGVTMNVWYNGYADPKEMEKLGYDIISTPDAWVYIVPHAGYYHDFLDTAKLFSDWEPIQVGKVRFPEGDPQIKGGSFAVWNDKLGAVTSYQDVNDRVFPAMRVLSQKMWRGTDTAESFADFCTGAARIGAGPGVDLTGKSIY